MGRAVNRPSAWGWSIALVVAIAPACAQHGAGVAPDRTTSGAPSAAAIDDSLMAYLSLARALHHEADLAEDAGDPSKAIATLERLVARPKPRAAPEIDEVLADTYARLGDLRSSNGDVDGAARDLEAGLALARETSYFRGHLFEVRGVVEERRSKALAKSGDAAGATLARQAAMKAFEQAVEIQGQVIDRARATGGEK